MISACASYWTGLELQSRDLGTWSWNLTDTLLPATYYNWGPTEPNGNQWNNEKYVLLLSSVSGTWFDIFDVYDACPICEWNP